MRTSTPVIETLELRTLMSYTPTDLGILPTDANQPSSAVPALDAAGDVYVAGGTDSNIDIFKIDKNTHAETTVVSNIGGAVLGMVIDSNGDLFYAANTVSGNLFELASGQTTPVALNVGYAVPISGGLTIDSAGNVYGVADDTGADNDGVVFEYDRSISTLHAIATFHGSDGFFPQCTLAVNASGDLFGTTIYGYAGAPAGDSTADNNGTVFEVVQGSGVVTTLASFDPTSTGQNPQGSVAIDSAGDVFGTAYKTDTLGVVFEYDKATGSIVDLYNFTGGNDGSLEAENESPLTGVVIDGSGDLFGTSQSDPQYSGSLEGTYGSLYELPNDATSVTTIATAITTVFGNVGFLYPENGVTLDGSGNLYVMTADGSTTANDNGTIYEFSPTGSGGGTTGGGVTTTTTATLTPTLDKSSIPTSQVAGTKLKGSEALTLTNSTSAKNSGKDLVELFATTTGSIDSSSVLVGKATKKFSLNAGQTGNITVPAMKLALPEGDYIILAQTTDMSGNITDGSTGPALVVAAPVVALSGVIGSFAPAESADGKSVGLSFMVLNGGNVDSKGQAIIMIGLTDNNSTDSTPVSTQSKSVTIKAGGKPTKVTVHFKLPVGQATGVFEPFVTFTQGTATFTQIGSATLTVT